MALDRRTREEILAHCGEIHEDDGIDPRKFFSTNPKSNKENRKAKQLCRQVAETIDLVLSGEIGDELLNGLRVTSVVPAPDSSRLLVILQTDCSNHQVNIEAIHARLAAASGQLRHAVATSITRRKAPMLAFQVIGFSLDTPSEGVEDEP